MHTLRRFGSKLMRSERLTNAFLAGCISMTGDIVCQYLEISNADATSKPSCKDDFKPGKEVTHSSESKRTTTEPWNPNDVTDTGSQDKSSRTVEAINNTTVIVATASECHKTPVTLVDKLSDFQSRMDMTRLGAVSLFGFAIAGPLGSWWYPFIDRFMLTRFPHFKPGSFKFVGTKVLMEQIFIGPIYTASFFPCVSLVEQSDSLVSFIARMKRDFLKALVIDEIGWLILSPITYKFVPVRWQLLVTSALGVVENMAFSFIQHNGFPAIPMLGIEGVAQIQHPVPLPCTCGHTTTPCTCSSASSSSTSSSSASSSSSSSDSCTSTHLPLLPAIHSHEAHLLANAASIALSPQCLHAVCLSPQCGHSHTHTDITTDIHTDKRALPTTTSNTSTSTTPTPTLTIITTSTNNQLDPLSKKERFAP